MASKLEQVELHPDPYEPYAISQAIKYNGLVYVSGQAGIDEQGKLVGTEGDFVAQANQAFKNLDRVLQASSSSLSQVIKVTIFVTDMASQFSHVVDMRKKYFSLPYPADSIVEVKGLFDPKAMIEIEAIAATKNGSALQDYASR